MATEPLSNPPPIVIGRDAANDVVCTDRCVSRRHAQLVYRDAHWIVCDLGSTNGTYLNDERCTSETPLKYGDRLRLARFGPEFVFPDDFNLPVPVPPPKKASRDFKTHFSRTLSLMAASPQQAASEQPAPPIPPPPSPPKPVSVAPLPRNPEEAIHWFFRFLAAISPRSAVLDSWRILESALRHRYEDVFRKRPNPCGMCVYDVINALHERHMLCDKDVESLHTLRDLRNKAAHHTIFALEPKQAEAYAEQTLSYARRIHLTTFTHACETSVYAQKACFQTFSAYGREGLS